MVSDMAQKATRNGFGDEMVVLVNKVNDDGTLTTVILIGEHENFYDELKNYVRKHLGG